MIQPNILQSIPELIEINQNRLAQGGYYVYAWFCADWFGTCFYVGMGSKKRYIDASSRGRYFKAVYDKWNVYPVILESGLTEEEAALREDAIKTELTFEHGYPIMDGEGRSGVLQCAARRLGVERKRAECPEWTGGRPEKPIANFAECVKRVSAGQVSVTQLCAELGIARSTWYDRLKSARL